MQLGSVARNPPPPKVVIARFIDLVGTMLFTGSMFILFGLTLIAVAFGAEKYRKGLINKIFPHHAIQK